MAHKPLAFSGKTEAEEAGREIGKWMDEHKWYTAFSEDLEFALRHLPIGGLDLFLRSLDEAIAAIKRLTSKNSAEQNCVGRLL